MKTTPKLPPYPSLEKQGKVISFPWNLACYSNDGYLRWFIPVHDKRTLKLLRLLWESHEGRCEVSRSKHTNREYWCRRVIFKREGEIYLKTWFDNLLQLAIWRYLWAMRGRGKQKDYSMRILIKPFEIKLWGGKENVPELRLGWGEAEGLKFSSAQKRALKSFRKDDNPPF